MSTLAQLQKDRAEHVANLKELEEILVVAPDMEGAPEMKADVLAQLANVDAQIAQLKSVAVSPSEPSEAKWSKENHPAFRKQPTAPATPVTPATPAAPAEERKTQTSFNINDAVLAKYAADKQFYEARIISITGSSAAPIYAVNFKGYTGTETVRAQDLRPLPSSAPATTQKRKADGSPKVSSSATPITSTSNSATPGVISAAANIDSDLARAVKKETAKPLDSSVQKNPAKKLKGNKALESSKNSWQAWQNKAGSSKVAKVAAKESMFRTGESHTAKVGFTGSGKTMTKDAARSRHNYDVD